jgi:hypothetical protein
MASELVNSALQIGGSLAVALIGSLFYAVLGAHPRPGDVERAFFWATTTIALCTAVAALLVSSLAASPKPPQRSRRCASCMSKEELPAKAGPPLSK